MRADAVRIVGLAVRTSNAKESNPAVAKIPSLWGRYDFEIYRDGTPVEIWVAVRES